MACKITKEMAQRISRAIAEKAFEHLIPAAQAELKKLGLEASEMALNGINIALLRSRNIIGQPTDEMEINVYAKGDGSFDNEVCLHGPGWQGVGYWNAVRVVNNDLYARAYNARERLNTLTTSANKLRQELLGQCIGKSSKAVLEAWPEAASIISSITNEPITTGFVTPLESLLAGSLPPDAAGTYSVGGLKW